MDYIWTMWWQGYKQAPAIVKCCIESMKRYNEGVCITVIDASNYEEYISIPFYIEEKFRQGMISVTHLSDIIRMKLISKYGGLWIDAIEMLPPMGAVVEGRNLKYGKDKTE